MLEGFLYGRISEITEEAKDFKSDKYKNNLFSYNTFHLDRPNYASEMKFQKGDRVIFSVKSEYESQEIWIIKELVRPFSRKQYEIEPENGWNSSNKDVWEYAYDSWLIPCELVEKDPRKLIEYNRKLESGEMYKETKHISEIKSGDLNAPDLVRFFEYIILQK